MKHFVLSAIAFTLSLIVAGPSASAQGVWTQLTNSNPSGSSGAMMLLTDGTIMVCAGNGFNGVGASAIWTKLTPDASGNYVNGTWTTLAPMSLQRLYFPANVLPSGKVFVIGGEYSGPFTQPVLTNSGEIYDPVTNHWSAISTFPQPYFGDDPTQLLTNGKILCGYIFGPQTYLYDPNTNAWSQTGTKQLSDRSDEETWSILSDGSVLSYNVFASPATGTGTAQRYLPGSGQWVPTGPVPVPLTGPNFGYELGPGMLLPNGRYFLLGANNNTVIYNPATNSWTQGPSLPTNFGCDDAAAAMLPNGTVLFLADMSAPVSFTPPTKAFIYDPSANSITDVTPTGAFGSMLATAIAQEFVMLMAPNGHVLVSAGNTMWDYAPIGSPNAAWAPTISSVKLVSGSTYTLTGTQLNGLSEGTAFGDDIENSTNYPIVRLKSSTGVVKYARTTNWSPGVIASGGRQLTTQFTLPAGLLNGTYQLSVIANGISSASQPFVLGPPFIPSNVTATYAGGSKTLTITGDANANSLTVSLQAGVLKVEGANGTTINHTTSFSTAHSGKLNLNVTLLDGDDSIAVIGVDSSTTNISLGAGNDNAAFTLSNVGTLTIDGGAGIDTFIKTSTTIGTLHETNIP